MIVLDDQLKIIFGDYGHRDCDLVTITDDNHTMVLVEDPRLLYAIALGLTMVTPVEACEIIQPLKFTGIGFKTNKYTVIIKLPVITKWIDGNPQRVAQANQMASLQFRRRYCHNPIKYRRRYNYLTKYTPVIHSFLG